MGQKVNPHGARVGVIFNWSTRWYAGKKDFANNLVEDYKLREMLKKKYYATGISHIDIERSANRVTINIFTAKPGMIIGRGGAGVRHASLVGVAHVAEGRSDALGDSGHRPRLPVERRLDGAAVSVPQHQQKPRVQVLAGVYGTGQLNGPHDVAGHADDKQLA